MLTRSLSWSDLCCSAGRHPKDLCGFHMGLEPSNVGPYRFCINLCESLSCNFGDSDLPTRGQNLIRIQSPDPREASLWDWQVRYSRVEAHGHWLILGWGVPTSGVVVLLCFLCKQTFWIPPYFSSTKLEPPGAHLEHHFVESSAHHRQCWNSLLFCRKQWFWANCCLWQNISKQWVWFGRGLLVERISIKKLAAQTGEGGWYTIL